MVSNVVLRDGEGAKLQLALWYFLALFLMVLDQYSKAMATSYLSYGEQIVVLPWFNWTLLHNTGAAFSFLSDAGGWQNLFFCTVAIVVSAILVVWLYRAARHDYWQNAGLSLVLGGALGNLYDRIALGYVVDFIQLHYQQHYWPAFNVADTAITTGAIILVVLSFRSDGMQTTGPDDEHGR